MAINKISGNILQDNLLRGANLAIQTDLVFFDIINNRVGINTTVPSVELTVDGTIYANNLTGNTVSAVGNVTGGNILFGAGQVVGTGNITAGNLLVSGNSSTGNLISLGTVSAVANIVTGNVIVGNKLIPLTGNVDVGNVNIVNVLTPVDDSDAATKGYVDTVVGNLSITISDGANSQTVENNNTITFAATANQTTVVVGAVDTATFGVAANLSVDSVTYRTTGNVVLTPNSSGFAIVDGTNGVVIPVGNTTQRPLSPPTGTIRFNTNANDVELWNGSAWAALGNVPGQITNQYITGDGSTTVFALDQETTTAAIIVSTNGVVQFPNIAYTVSGNSITFAEAPAATDVIDVRFTALVNITSSVVNTAGQELIITTPGVVDITNTHSIQLPTYTVAQANALGNTAPGQVIYVSDGDGGNPCLAVYSGGAWKRVSLGANIST